MACKYSMVDGLKTEHKPHLIGCLLHFLANPWTHEFFRSWNPDLFIDVSETERIKYNALKCFEHVRLPSGEVPSMLREHRLAADRLSGVISGCRFAEAFKFPFDRFMKLAFDWIPDNFLTPKPMDAHENLIHDLPAEYTET